MLKTSSAIVEISGLRSDTGAQVPLVTLASTNVDQSVPNLATIYLPIRFQSHLPLNLKKIAEYDFVYTLASTNIDQSALNFIKMYVIIRSRMSYIMDLIKPELSELSALELENLPFFYFNYTLASANIDQSVPNLATIYLPIRSRMSLNMGPIKLEHLELFALELGKYAESGFVYTLASTNINQ